jgi:hypothetical protein
MRLKKVNFKNTVKYLTKLQCVIYNISLQEKREVTQYMPVYSVASFLILLLLLLKYQLSQKFRYKKIIS